MCVYMYMDMCKYICICMYIYMEFHGQRNLVGYSSWGPKELDMTLTDTHIYTYVVVVQLLLCPTL